MRAILILIILNLIVIIALLIDAKSTSEGTRVHVNQHFYAHTEQQMQLRKELL
jgi:FtsZ-interacting cell division protein ZipA